MSDQPVGEPRVSGIERPEIATEQEITIEQDEPGGEQMSSQEGGGGAEQQSASVSSAHAVTVPPKDPVYQKVEAVLEENLEDIYRAMTPADQLRFKVKGEETAEEIQTLIETAKATFRKVLHLIRGWLKTIPGVNKLFLEQESKLKTDQIMTMAKEEKK